MDRLPRRLASIAVGVITFVAAYLFLFPNGCTEPGPGVPSWEKCVTVMGNPAFSLTDLGLDNTFDILIPLVVGSLFGLLTWSLLAPSGDADG